MSDTEHTYSEYPLVRCGVCSDVVAPSCATCDWNRAAQKAREAERERLVKLAYAMQREGWPFTPEAFEKAANVVIEYHSSGEGRVSEDGNRYEFTQKVRIKDARDD